MPMRVTWLVLENFKSYDQQVRVGPFRNFTCIVGPNGAGKSNLVDAMCFVLGVATRALRSERLQDLIHRKEMEVVLTRTAVVELICELDGEVAGEDGELNRVAFRRVIQPGVEGSRFLVNEEVVSQAAYMSRLERMSIFPKARNFLVLQGDVQKAAGQQGKELTSLLEQVSGSGALREEYEKLAVEKASKEDAARHLYAERRSAVHEKKRVAQQKDEAKRYKKLDAERRKLEVEFCLYRLHCIRQSIEQLLQKRVQEERSRSDADVAVAERLRVSKDADQKRARTHLEALAAEKKAREKAKHLEDTAPGEQAQARLEALQQRLQELQASQKNRETRRRELQAQVKQLRDEKSQEETELRELATAADEQTVNFTSDERQEFEELREEARKLTAASSAQVRDLEAQIRAVAKDRARAEQDVREISLKQQHLRQRVVELSDDAQKRDENLQLEEGLVGERQRQLQNMDTACGERATKKTGLVQERGTMLENIKDIAAAKRQLVREDRLKNITQELKRLVPGVHGRILDLCQEADPRFRVAVSVALGGSIDGVVSDTANGARQCIQHLKAKMLESLTFLPLDNLRVHPLDKRVNDLLRINPRLRLAINCVRFEPQLARAFEFLLSDVVIADNLDEARRFFYDELQPLKLQCRIVTLQGETISMDGNIAISAGVSQTRFEFAELNAKKTALEAIDRQLSDIDSLDAAVTADRAALAQDIGRIEEHISASRQTLSQQQEELKARQAALQEVSQDAETVNPRVQSLTEQEANLLDEQRQLERDMDQVTREIFAELSRRKDVEDIAAVEREDRRKCEERKARKRTLEQKKGRLEAEIAMLEQTLTERGLQDPVQDIAEAEAEIEEIEQRQGAEQNVEIAQQEITALKAKFKELQEKEREEEKGATRLALEARELQNQLGEVKGRLKGLAVELRTLRDTCLDLLRQSVLDDIDIPFLRHGYKEALQELAAAAVAASQRLAMDAEDPAEDICGAIDFSRLPDKNMNAIFGDRLEDEYREKLDRMAKELERLQPNLKAADQFAAAAEQVTQAEQGMAVAQRSREDVDQRFERVREQRKLLFMACYSVVRDQIGPIYKKLTADTLGNGIEGGKACLDVEDFEDPFKAGVTFTVAPPGKGLNVVALLSGGEKTLAAMALLFALQAFQRPPFLLLDEIDAHLDHRNLQALASYMAQSECQAIVVSLKDRFFCRSEGLVGVTRNPRTQSSVIFTVDLDRFRQGSLVPASTDDAADGGGLGTKLPQRVASSPLPLAGSSPVATM